MANIVQPTVKSTHSDSASMGYVTPAGGDVDNANVNRKGTAKSKKQGMPNADTSAAQPVSVMPAGQVNKEDLDMVFGGIELSEDAMDKALTLFEGAVSAKVSEIAEQLTEEFETKLAESLTEAVAELEEKVGDYLDLFTEEYMKENELAISNGIKAEIAESLIESLKNLVLEHNVVIPEESVDLVESMAERIEELEAELNESINSQVANKKLIESFERTAIVNKLTEGLDDVSKDKLVKLSEHISFTNVDSFESKVVTLKESIAPVKQTSAVSLTESVQVEDDADKARNDRVSMYVKAARNFGS